MIFAPARNWTGRNLQLITDSSPRPRHSRESKRRAVDTGHCSSTRVRCQTVRDPGGPFRLAVCQDHCLSVSIGASARVAPGVTRINLVWQKAPEPRRAVVLSGKSFV